MKSHKSLGTSRFKRHAKARATKRENAPVSIGGTLNENHPTGFTAELNWNGKRHIRQSWPDEPSSVLAKSFHCDTWESAIIPLAEKSSTLIPGIREYRRTLIVHTHRTTGSAAAIGERQRFDTTP